MANKLYVNKAFELNDKFAADSKNLFDSEVQNLNFSEKEKSATEINTWVCETQNKFLLSSFLK